MKFRMYFIALVIILISQACSNVKNVNQKVEYENVVIKESEEGWPEKFNIGRLAKEEEIRLIDIDVRSDGQWLPDGFGSVSADESIYRVQCESCHGTKTSDGIYDRLFSYVETGVTADSSKDRPRVKTIGNYWPYATTLYDYINRAMPFNAPGSLSPDEVYSITAYL